jgi:hypothetical protein
MPRANTGHPCLDSVTGVLTLVLANESAKEGPRGRHPVGLDNAPPVTKLCEMQDTSAIHALGLGSIKRAHRHVDSGGEVSGKLRLEGLVSIDSVGGAPGEKAVIAATAGRKVLSTIAASWRGQQEVRGCLMGAPQGSESGGVRDGENDVGGESKAGRGGLTTTGSGDLAGT